MPSKQSFPTWAALFINTMIVMSSMIALISVGSVSEAATGPDGGNPAQQTPSQTAEIPRSPLRVMVPTNQTWASLKARGYNSMFDVFPSLTPASYRPGPRMPVLNRLNSRPNGVSGVGPNPVMAPTNFRMLAILVDFNDNVSQVSASFFDTLVFGTTTSQTVNRFYNETSYGLLDIVTLNLPSTISPPGGTTGWQRAPQTYSYYVGGNYCTDGGYPHDCRRLTEDVTALVDPVVDFSQYDNDGDGYVDTVFIIHAGQGAEATGNPNHVWSHSWWTVTEPVYDGVKVGSYTTEPEFWFDPTPGDMTHGVFAHELGHALGLPDLYDIDYSSEGIGNWSMMSGGSWNGINGNTPAHFDAWSRIFLGFNDPVNVTGTEQIITIPSVQNNQSSSIFRLNGVSANEYWLLENRQLLGSDSALPAAGLLIWHVDDAVTGSNNFPCRLLNNFWCASLDKHFKVALEQADGLLNLEQAPKISGVPNPNSNQGDAGDPFPGASNNRTFNISTNPNTSSYYTLASLGVSISQISNSGPTMTARIGPQIADPVTLVAPVDGAITDARTPNFDWDDLPGAQRYNIIIDNDPGFGSPRVNNSNLAGSSFTPYLTPLADGDWYWQVRAAGSDTLWGPWSPTRNLTVDTVRPDRPTPTDPANGSSIGDNTPTFMWTGPGDAASYHIQLDTTPFFGSANKVDGYSNTTDWTPMLGSELMDGRWYWRVQAIDAAGNMSYWSVAFNVFINAVPTPVPTLLAPASGTLSNSRVFTFDWTDEVGVKRYNIQVDNEPAFTAPMRVNVNVFTSTFTNGALPLGNGTWYWQVRAVGTDDMPSDWSETWELEVDAVRPARPTPVSPTFNEVVHDSTPTFAWTAIPDAVSYIVQIDRNIYFRSPDKQEYAVVGTNVYDIPAPLYDRAWVWRVRSVDAAGNVSFWSPNSRVLVNAIETPVPTPLSPADPLLTKDRVLTFDWTDEEDVQRYNLQVDNEPSFTAPMRINVNVFTSQFRNWALPLGSGTWYWQVRAQGTDGFWGDFSAPRSLEVDIVKPGRPTLLSPANFSTTADNTPEFTWNVVPDADVVGYIIQIDVWYYFASPNKIQAQVVGTSFTPAAPLADRRWFWRVAAVDAAGNVSFWSPFWNVVVDTGATSSGGDPGAGQLPGNLTREQLIELWRLRNRGR